jgi:hypothetical protein
MVFGRSDALKTGCNIDAVAKNVVSFDDYVADIDKPGGICLSSSAFDQVCGKVVIEFAVLGLAESPSAAAGPKSGHRLQIASTIGCIGYMLMMSYISPLATACCTVATPSLRLAFSV